MSDERDAIANLIERYCWTVDHRLWDEWLACFAEDGIFAVRGQELQGREAIRAYVEGSVGDYRLVRHLSFLPAIELRGDGHAWARSYFEMRGVTARGYDVHALGSYVDDLRRTAEGWQFVRRFAHFDYFSRRERPWLEGGDA